MLTRCCFLTEWLIHISEEVLVCAVVAIVLVSLQHPVDEELLSRLIKLIGIMIQCIVGKNVCC